jgi:hypothetical protein
VTEALDKFIRHDWGGFEASVTKYVKYPEPSKPVTRSYQEREIFQTFTGFYVDVDHNAPIETVFPRAWAEAARKELQLFITRPVPSTFQAKLAWTVNVAWLTTSYLLASNIYPQIWSDTLRIARYPDWIPYQAVSDGTTFPDNNFGWDVEMQWAAGTWIADSLLWPFNWLYQMGGWDDSANRAVSCGIPSLGFCDPSGGIPGAIIARWFAPEGTWHGRRVSTELINHFPHLKFGTTEPFKGTYFAAQLAYHSPWTGQSAGMSDEVLTYFHDNAAKVDPQNKQGLYRLASRAALFGGLGKLSDYTNSPYSAAGMNELDGLVSLWSRLGRLVSGIPYATMLAAGIQAWNVRASNFFWPQKYVQPSIEPASMYRQPMAFQDEAKLVHDYQKEHKKQGRIGIAAKAIGEIVEIVKDFFIEDYYGMAKQFWINMNAGLAMDKTGKYAPFFTDRSQQPNLWSFVIPPLFLRVYAKGSSRVAPLDDFNVVSTNPRTKKTETLKGTDAMMMVVRQNLGNIEQRLGFAILDVQITAATGAKASVSRASAGKKADPKKDALVQPRVYPLPQHQVYGFISPAYYFWGDE